MPHQNGQGPVWGGGPGAGRGIGPCACPPSASPFGEGRRGGRRGAGLGRGCGMGWGFMPSRVYGGYNYGYQLSKDEELKMMDNEEAALKEDLEALQKARQQLQSEKK